MRIGASGSLRAGNERPMQMSAHGPAEFWSPANQRPTNTPRRPFFHPPRWRKAKAKEETEPPLPPSPSFSIFVSSTSSPVTNFELWFRLSLHFHRGFWRRGGYGVEGWKDEWKVVWKGEKIAGWLVLVRSSSRYGAVVIIVGFVFLFLCVCVCVRIGIAWYFDIRCGTFDVEFVWSIRELESDSFLSIFENGLLDIYIYFVLLLINWKFLLDSFIRQYYISRF